MSNTGTHSHPFQANLRNSGADILRDHEILRRGPELRSKEEKDKPKVIEVSSDWPFPTSFGKGGATRPGPQMKGNTLAGHLSTQRHGV